MAEPLRFEPFDRKRHERSRFDCGVAALNEYLRTSLGQHGRKDLTRGYVAVDAANCVIGYFTLAAGRLAVSLLPERRGLPTKMPLPGNRKKDRHDQKRDRKGRKPGLAPRAK